LQQDKRHTAEFEACIKQVMRQGHEKESAFAICTATFHRAHKPIFAGESERQKLHLFSESIKVEGNKVSGVAIHPKRIFHPEEDLTHVYLHEELEKAAPSLVGKPFGIDHLYVLPPPNIVTNAWFDSKENGVAFEGTVDDGIAEQIRNKVFKGLSIELDWLRPGGKVEYVNGVAPRNFELTSVHLLHRFPAGDKEAYIRLWEQVVAGPPLPLDQRVEAVERQVQDILNRIDVIEGKLEILADSTRTSPSGSFEKLKEAAWTAEYIDDLGDEAFAVISEGGQKDEQGKTVPRKLRHLPHHRADGSLDLVHLRNALSRLPQTELTSEEQAEAKRHLCTHARESQVTSEVCGEEAISKDQSSELVSLRKRIFDLEAELAEANRADKQGGEIWRRRYLDFHQSIESVVPASRIWKSWSPGPQRMVQALLKAIREAGEAEGSRESRS